MEGRLYSNMKVLHLLTGGQIGGIETLCREIGKEPLFDSGFCFLTCTGDIYEQMSSLGMKVFDLTHLGAKMSIRKIIRLISISREYDIIIVHHGDPYLKMYFCILSLLTRKKMVSYIHSCYDTMFLSEYSRMKIELERLIYKMSFILSDMVIFVSEAGMKSYTDYFKYSFEKKSRVIYNGISTDILDSGAKYNIHFRKPYNITYIGRLSKIKGVQILIEAYARLIQNNENINLTIVGDGDYRESLEKRVTDLRLKSVFFAGKTVDIKNYLEKASIFVYPSIIEEVFGISIAEAMAYGIPSIGSDIGGIPEVIENGHCGWLCKPNDVNDLQKKIMIAINAIENGHIESISANAKRKAAEFSIQRTVKKIAEALQTLIDN